jgi:hypothetical protein
VSAGRGVALAVVAALVALVAPGVAAAIYRPTLALSFDRYGPAQAPAVTAIMRQRLGEDATRTIASRFPPDFTYNPDFAVVGCDAAHERAATCPPESRLGSVDIVSPLGRAGGGVYLTSDFRLFVPVSALGGIYRAPIDGKIHALADGSPEIVFDGLPKAPVTEARIALDGGPRAIFITPRRCGRYSAGARFVGYGGTQVALTLPLQISGCVAALGLDRVRVAPRRVLPGRRPRLSWRLSRAALRTELTLFRAKRGEWRELATTRAPAAAGRNQLRLPRRWRSPLRRVGRFRLVLRATAADGVVSRARTARFRVVATP